MDLQELRQEAIKIIKANPELKSEIQDLFSLAISEVEEGGSESHECDLAYNDMIELQNEANNNKMVRGGKLTERQQVKFDKVMSEWKAGKLHSGSSDGPIVTDQDQAIAIAYAQANGMKKMEFGGLVYDSLSDEAKDRMNGLVPTEQINYVLSNCRYIVSQMMEEGFELDEAISFIVYKIVDDFTDKRMGYFSDEYYPEDWKSDQDKPKVLVKLYDLLSKADNLDYLSWEYDEDEGYSIEYRSGLESESDYHKGEIESYTFYVDEYNDGLIESLYDLNGFSATGLTIDQVLNAVRANNKMAHGGSVDQYIAYIQDTRKPGGTNKEIYQDYGLKVTERDRDGFNVIGNKKDIEDFIKDHSIILEEEIKVYQSMDRGGSVEDDEIEEYAEAIYEDLRQEYKPWELQNMSMEEAMMSVDSYDEIPENLKEEVASYLMNMASQNEFFEEDEEYKDGGPVQSKEEKMIASKAKAIFRDLKRDGYDKFDLAMMTKEEANETVSTFSDVPDNLKKEVADYLFMMCQRIPFGQGGSMYNKGGIIENKMQSLENELNRLESELKWTQQQNGASKQYYLRKRRSGKMTRERAMELIDQSNASWKKEREKVREKIKEVKDRIKRLEELSSKVNADQFAYGGGVEDIDYGFSPRDLLDEMIKTPWGIGRIYEVAGKGSNQHVKIDIDGKTHLMNMGEIRKEDIVKYVTGGAVDDDDVYFATVINKKDPNYNRLAYSKSQENTKDKDGNEFDKLYFENKKTPLKYNVKDLNYNVRKIHDFKDVQGRKFMLLKELQKDKTLYYYIVHSGDKKVYTESGNMNAIKEYLKNLTNGKDFYSKPGINFADGGGVGEVIYQDKTIKVIKPFQGEPEEYKEFEVIANGETYYCDVFVNGTPPEKYENRLERVFRKLYPKIWKQYDEDYAYGGKMQTGDQ